MYVPHRGDEGMGPIHACAAVAGDLYHTVDIDLYHAVANALYQVSVDVYPDKHRQHEQQQRAKHRDVLSAIDDDKHMMHFRSALVSKRVISQHKKNYILRAS